VDDYRAGVNHHPFFGYQYPPDGKEESGTKTGIRRIDQENPGIFTVVSQALKEGGYFRLMLYEEIKNY
jgi:hypothetical protein